MFSDKENKFENQKTVEKRNSQKKMFREKLFTCQLCMS